MRRLLRLFERSATPREAWVPPRPSRLLMRALEPRLMFDGALAAEAITHVAEPLPIEVPPPCGCSPARTGVH